MIGTPSHDDFAAALQQPAASVPAGLRAADRQEIERRFAVHRNNFVVTLIDALAASFPVSQAMVGAAFFRAMARERVLAEPPQGPVLTDYALGFPDFIARFPPADAVPYLADVARVEALRIQAYHAADAAPVLEAAYRPLLAAPERLATTQVKLHPACCWFRSRHAAYSLWQAHQGLEDMAEADLSGIDTTVPEDLLIARPALDVAVAILPTGAIAWLEALGRGSSLETAFLQSQEAAADADPHALLSLLIRHGLVADLIPLPEK